DPDIGLFVMPYDTDVNKLVGVNYRVEPLSVRLARLGLLTDADEISPEMIELSTAIYDPDTFGDPSTDVFEAHAGDPIRFRVVSGYSEQNQVFSVEAHSWGLTPTLEGTDVVSSRYLTPGGVLNVEIEAAGGPQHRPGDYMWGNHRLPYQKAGQWGLMRVLDPNETTDLVPLDELSGSGG
ncbi:MAG: hypothetical protein OEV40_16345, partial [Acidimicrobiia bacterium]|nr:hypothetical protein [Acidimicrobiia bacterium]